MEGDLLEFQVICAFLWQEETGSTVAWPSYQRMVLEVAGTAEMKSDMIELLRANSNHLFTNHVVHMLMVALTIFSGDDIDRNVRQVHAFAESMLRVHLASEEATASVLRCVSVLPRMAQLKQRMKGMKQMHFQAAALHN